MGNFCRIGESYDDKEEFHHHSDDDDDEEGTTDMSLGRVGKEGTVRRSLKWIDEDAASLTIRGVTAFRQYYVGGSVNCMISTFGEIHAGYRAICQDTKRDDSKLNKKRFGRDSRSKYKTGINSIAKSNWQKTETDKAAVDIDACIAKLVTTNGDTVQWHICIEYPEVATTYFAEMRKDTSNSYYIQRVVDRFESCLVNRPSCPYGKNVTVECIDVRYRSNHKETLGAANLFWRQRQKDPNKRLVQGEQADKVLMDAILQSLISNPDMFKSMATLADPNRTNTLDTTSLKSEEKKPDPKVATGGAAIIHTPIVRKLSTDRDTLRTTAHSMLASLGIMDRVSGITDESVRNKLVDYVRVAIDKRVDAIPIITDSEFDSDISAETCGFMATAFMKLSALYLDVVLILRMFVTNNLIFIGGIAHMDSIETILNEVFVTEPIVSYGSIVDKQRCISVQTFRGEVVVPLELEQL